MSEIILTLLMLTVFGYGIWAIRIQYSRRRTEFQVATLAAEAAEKAATVAGEMQEGIRQIHVLVNSNLMSAIQGEIDQAHGKLDALNRLGKLNEEDLKDIAKTHRRIKELTGRVSRDINQLNAEN